SHLCGGVIIHVYSVERFLCFFFFFQAEDGIRDFHVTGVQTCALPISGSESTRRLAQGPFPSGFAPGERCRSCTCLSAPEGGRSGQCRLLVPKSEPVPTECGAGTGMARPGKQIYKKQIDFYLLFL